jgi:hypothetical protein
MILVTDILFPCKYGKWRIEESKAFIDRYNADFLVYKIDSYSKINYDFDYDEMKEYYGLNDYNILIFDQKYNHLNKFNTRIDGKRFNTINGFSYLFTKNENFDIKNYKYIYHIFLSMYEKFNKFFKVEYNKQFIHLYPGGGLSGKNAITKIHKDANVISTSPITTKWLKEAKHENFIEVLGGTLLPKNNIVIPKQKNIKTLRVCFSSMGDPEQKGAFVYRSVVEQYKKMFPQHDIEFISIGNGVQSKYIKSYKPMSVKDLDEFYSKNVDIIINLENGKAYNGWPLGCEAMLQGVVLITTDIYNCKDHFKYTDDMIFIVNKNDVNNIIKIIHNLYNDRDKLLSMSLLLQKHVNNILSYENQQAKIFDFIDNRFYSLAISTYRKIVPKSFTDNTVFKVKQKVNPFLTYDNVKIENDNIKNLIFNSIKNNIPISLARYNDGEWICMLRIKEKNAYNIHRVKWDKNAEEFMDKFVTPIIKKVPYYVGISTEVLKKDYMVENIFEYIKDLNLFDGGLFSRWQIDGTIFELFELLKNKKVIIVGPDYLSKLNSHLNFIHIVTENNLNLNRVSMIKPYSVKDTCAVVKQYPLLLQKLQECIEDNCVVLYSCSFAAKRLIHDFHNKNIIQLDIGSAFDNLCGLQTRPWHFF